MAQRAFEEVVAAHHPEIYRYLRRVASRPADADDIAQETFLRAYRAWGRLDPDANVRAWLFAIATNLNRNHHRAERRRSRFQAAVRAAQADVDRHDPEGASLGDEMQRLVERIVRRLPDRQRMAFVMRKVHDLDYDAIGRSLGCTPDTARAHVFQALRKIRLGLNGCGAPRREDQR